MGREAELDRLLTIGPDRGPAPAVVISSIDGMAGIGKTALAVRAAHRLSGRFPDGQLFIDLHGFTERLPPVEPAEALDRLLRTLGMPAERIPVDLDDKAALWRSVLAGRRMLLVLDNAATEAQVEPLLPGAPGCLVLVTSRRRLPGLEPSHALSLETLSLADATTLFTVAAGADRVAPEPRELLDDVVELCGRLPLAIRIAATRFRHRPTWSLQELARRLRDHERRLGELSDDDGPRSIQATLDLSYRQLSRDERSLYRLLGLHPGPDIDPYAAAALTAWPLARARRTLETLLDAHLLQELAPDRYGLHDLVRAHAHTVATGDPAPDERRRGTATRREPLTRLFDYYRHVAAAAMDTAHPYERDRRPRVPPAATPTPDLRNPNDATGWLGVELPNLLAAAWYAAEHGWPDHAIHLSAVLHRHLRARGYYHDAESLHRRALELAPTADHPVGKLDALFGLANAHRRQGRLGESLTHYRQALEFARSGGYRTSELDALAGLGGVHLLRGEYEQAVDIYRQAIEIARAAEHRPGEVAALTGLGAASLRQGRYAQAIEYGRQALDVARSVGHPTGQLGALTGLGAAHLAHGQYAEALDRYREAQDLAGSIGHRASELAALTGLGHAQRLGGDHETAAGTYRRALDLAQEINNRTWAFEARYGLGRLTRAQGDPATALTHYRHALELAAELHQPASKARAHDGMALALRELRQYADVRTHWQAALELLTTLGTDRTEDGEASTATIRGHLAELDRHAPG